MRTVNCNHSIKHGDKIEFIVLIEIFHSLFISFHFNYKLKIGISNLKIINTCALNVSPIFLEDKEMMETNFMTSKLRHILLILNITLGKDHQKCVFLHCLNFKY